MTDSLSALRLVVETGMPEADQALASFYDRWRAEPLVVNKWFALQAMLEDDQSVERVERLMTHPAFTLTNPNRVRSVLAAFALQNLPASTAATAPATGWWRARPSSSTG
jgi:aminopeptidase N